MARDEEVAALSAIADAYERWAAISEHLHQEVAEAAERNDGAPLEALRADFNAQLAVTRSVAEFAHTCPPAGPDVEGLPGAAFIQALHHVVRSQPGLDQDLIELTARWEGWLTEIGRWTPDLSVPPPARPTSPALSRVLAAVDDWWGFSADRLHDEIVQSFANQGHHVTESVAIGTEGDLIQSANVVFEPSTTADVHAPAARGPLARLRRTLLGHRDSR